MDFNWITNFKNINFSEHIKDNLKRYYELIIEFNQKFNLTRITESQDVAIKHFYDSLLISNDIELSDQNICDVGTGLGVPGIVLKIVFSDLKLTLIESNAKKCQFLQTVVDKLDLKNVYVINARAEDFAHEYREIFDIVIARAVASLNILVELCVPLAKIDGLFIAYKSVSYQEELKAAQNSLKVMGAQLNNEYDYLLPYDYGKRNILVFKKNKLTALKYPRNYQQIKKQPL